MKLTEVINPVTGNKVDLSKQAVPLLLGIVAAMFIYQAAVAVKSWISGLVAKAAGGSAAGNGWTQQ